MTPANGVPIDEAQAVRQGLQELHAVLWPFSLAARSLPECPFRPREDGSAPWVAINQLEHLTSPARCAYNSFQRTREKLTPNGGHDLDRRVLEIVDDAMPVLIAALGLSVARQHDSLGHMAGKGESDLLNMGESLEAAAVGLLSDAEAVYQEAYAAWEEASGHTS